MIKCEYRAKSTINIIVMLFITAFVSSCSLTTKTPTAGNEKAISAEEVAKVEIAKDRSVQLPQPSQLGYQVTASQLISAQWTTPKGKQVQQLPVQLEVSNSKIVLAGFSSWGTRLLSLSYQDNHIETKVMSGLDGVLPDPEQILFNLMITLWPKETWHAPLDNLGWQIVESDNQRVIVDETGQKVIEIEYQHQQPLKGTIRFTHKSLDYLIEIQTLNYQIQSAQQ